LFNLTSLDPTSLTLERAPASFVYKYYSSGLLSFFKKLSDFHLALLEFHLTTKSNVSGFMVFPYDLDVNGVNQGDCIKVLNELSPWKKACANYLKDSTIREKDYRREYSTIRSLLATHLVNNGIEDYAPNRTPYFFLNQIRDQCLIWSDFYNAKKVDPTVCKYFYSAAFFEKHSLFFLIEQDLFIYSWLRVEQLKEFNSSFDLYLDLENRVLSSTVGEKYFKVVQDHMILDSLRCKLQCKNSIDVGISTISELVTEPKICSNKDFDNLTVSSTVSPSTWSRFFYDTLCLNYWLGTKTVPTPNIDFNVNGP